jgi:uncharacterized phage protein gp47/JayE
MFKTKQKQDIIRTAIADLASNSAIANLSPGSKARLVVEAVGEVIGAVATDLSLGMINTVLPNATGATLDLIADMVGIQRLPEIRARVETSDQNFKYYVKTGTFGDINSGNAFTIPAGTEIRTGSQRGRADATMIQRAAVTLPAGDSEAFFSADQIGQVRLRGIAAGALSRHDYIGYTDSDFQSLLVTNVKGIAGRPVESDQNLRFRIANRMQSAAEANLTSIRLNSLLVPGVSDVKIVPNKSGIGSYDVVVFGTSQVVADNVIQQVQDQIDRHQAVGTRGIAVGPRLVGLTMRIRLRFKDEAKAGEKNAAANAARQAIREFITDIRPGGRFIMNSLVRVVLGAHPMILDLGDPDDPFDQILVWRSTLTGDARFSRNLRQNLSVRNDEELLIEYSVDNPIELIEA